MSEGNEQDPGGDWEVVAEMGRRYKAELVAGRLQSAGIEAQVIDRSFRQGPVPVERPLALVRVWVPKARAEEARQLLDEIEGRSEDPSSGG